MHVLTNILRARSPRGTRERTLLRSCQCTQAQLESADFQGWCVLLREPTMYMHRKIWEYCYIAQALRERGMLAPGRRGLCFAVGQEPLPDLFASQGCEIVATDLPTEQAQQAGWVQSSQHAESLDALSGRAICDPALFRQRVSFRFLDMRQLPDDLGTYDFIWSACSLEHLGSMALGEDFIYQSLKYLKPGGVAVHTTEYNILSNDDTLTSGGTVLFRRQDLKKIAGELRRRGYRMDLDFSRGNMPYDRIVDTPPYHHDAHLSLLIGKHTATSFGLIIESAS